MASAQVVETTVANNSPSQDCNHTGDLVQSRYVAPGMKPFSYLPLLLFKFFYCYKVPWVNFLHFNVFFFSILASRIKRRK